MQSLLRKKEKNIISKDSFEYTYFKDIVEEHDKFKNTDFGIKLYKGTVTATIPPEVTIEIYNPNIYKIKIDDREYNINVEKYNRIKKIIEINMNYLIDYSKTENFPYLMKNEYQGGTCRTIKVKYGMLTIEINGQVKGDIATFCDQFIEDIRKIIID